ncbi:MAG: energy transducer TonB [Planctomycetota bacterium]
MSRLALRPSVLVSVALHAGALVGASAFAAGRGAPDREAVVLAFEAVDLGAAFDAPELPAVEPPADDPRLVEPRDVEPAVAEPPLPPEEAEVPPTDEPPPVAGEVPPLPAPSPTATTRPTRPVAAPAPATVPLAAPARPVPPVAPSVAQRAGAAQVSTLSRAHPSNRPPRYPEAALRAGWEGTTWLIVDVGPDGRVANVYVERSSGHDVLDEAALEAVAGWTYDPRLVDGVAAPDRLRLPVRFTSQAYALSR